MKPNTKKPKHGQLNAADRISALPDSIAHRIISFLGFKEACRTGGLSKRWTHISDTNPVMDLSHGVFSANPCLVDWYNSMVKVEKFLEYTEARMQRYSKDNLRIIKLTLGFPVLKLTFPNTEIMLIDKVDEWVEIAVRNQVEEIAISGPSRYQLPDILSAAHSLRCLHFSYLEIFHDTIEAMNLQFLESLYLHEAYLDDRTLNHIIGSSPLLKHLRLHTCRLKNIVIPCSSKLETLDLNQSVSKDGTVTIDTSSLTCFQYLSDSDSRPGWCWPVISKEGFLRNLRILKIGFASITDEVLGKLLSELILLETLKLCNCPTLSSVRISSALLKEIRLEHCADLLDVCIDAPCLKTFKYKGDFQPSVCITVNSKVGCDISLHVPPAKLYTESFETLKELLKGLNNRDVLKILLLDEPDRIEEECNDIDFDEEEFADAHLGPPCDIGELKLTLSSWILSKYCISGFLDGLFWTCHPRIFSLRVDLKAVNVTIEPLIRKLNDMAKCWKHPLKHVEVEGVNCSDLLEARKLDLRLRLCW